MLGGERERAVEREMDRERWRERDGERAMEKERWSERDRDGEREIERKRWRERNGEREIERERERENLWDSTVADCFPNILVLGAHFKSISISTVLVDQLTN